MGYPPPIQDVLAGFETDGENFRTASEANVFRYTDPTSNQTVFVKIQGLTPDPPLSHERDAMEWLAGKLIVPKVVAYHKENVTEYLVTTAIPGVSSENGSCHDDKQRLVEQLAQALLEIHTLSIVGCPIDRTAESLIESGHTRIAAGVVTRKMIDEEGLTGAPLDALTDLASTQPSVDGPVFTHGDYCLPNVMIENNRIAGFIDLGYAGVGDPYRDFTAAKYSVRRNLGEEWVQPFFDAYGIAPDEAKLDWYNKMQTFE
jgi:aminoglycoside phosphotransferase